MVEKIEKYRYQDETYWRYMYLGEVVGMGTNIYNMAHIHLIDELPFDDWIVTIDTSSDTGHQVSATTHGAYAITSKGNVILLDTYYYSPDGQSVKKAPSDLSADFKEWLDSVHEEWDKWSRSNLIDSAEGLYVTKSIKITD